MWFKEQLDADFPGWDVWMSDADEGMTSNAFSFSVSQSECDLVVSRCMCHLAKNAKKHAAAI